MKDLSLFSPSGQLTIVCRDILEKQGFKHMAMARGTLEKIDGKWERIVSLEELKEAQ